jgi:hypothetical protein
MNAGKTITGTTKGHGEVGFPRLTQSYGRNGPIKTSGVDITLTHYPKGAKHIPTNMIGKGDVTLAVITSRQNVSHNCYIELPADPDVLTQLAQELKDAAKAIEDGQAGKLPKQ